MQFGEITSFPGNNFKMFLHGIQSMSFIDFYLIPPPSSQLLDSNISYSFTLPSFGMFIFFSFFSLYRASFSKQPLITKKQQYKRCFVKGTMYVWVSSLILKELPKLIVMSITIRIKLKIGKDRDNSKFLGVTMTVRRPSKLFQTKTGK